MITLLFVIAEDSTLSPALLQFAQFHLTGFRPMSCERNNGFALRIPCFIGLIVRCKLREREFPLCQSRLKVELPTLIRITIIPL